MNCHLDDAALGDYVDGLDDAEFERHVTSCPRCQALVADLRVLRDAAATLEEHLPPPRVWAKVKAAVDERPRGFFAWRPLAVAAMLAAIVGAAVWPTFRQAPRPAPSPEQATASEPAEAPYHDAIASLQQLADEQSATLDPHTREVLQQNLAVVDRAIDESRAALADEPSSTLAQESLMDALDTKVALLQDSVELNQ